MEGNEPSYARVLSVVAQTPGESTRSIAASVGLNESTADYHLRRLAKDGKVVAEASARERRWYPAGRGWCPVLRRAMPEMRRGEAMDVAMALTSTPVTSNQLARASRVSVGQVRWIATRLEGTLILQKSRAGYLSLREEADICRDKAILGEPCDRWGKCPLAQEWTRRLAATTTDR